MRRRKEEDLISSIIEDWARVAPTLDTSGTDVVGRVVRASSLLDQKLAANLTQFNLHVGDFDVLAALLRSKKDELSPSELHQILFLTSGGLSNRLQRLELRGLISRSRSYEDGRGVAVKLTEEGKALVEQAAASHLALETSLASRLNSKDAETLKKLLQKLLVILETDDK